MANIVKIKRSAVASKIPTTADLELGELAINTFDGKLFTRKDDGTASIIEIGSGGGGGGGITYSLKTSNYTASDKEGILADTTAGSFTVTLPASPTIGASVVINDAADSFGTNNLIIARNGSTIETIADNLTLDIASISVSLIYTGTTWQVYSLVITNVSEGTYATGTGSASGTNTGDETLDTIKTKIGILPVPNGGTGASTLEANYILKGNGTSAVSPSVLYENSGYIGIGTTGPGVLFDAQQSFNGSGGISYTNLSTGASSAASITAEAGGSYFYHKITRATGIVQFRGITATTLNQDFTTQVFRSTGGSEYMRINSTGDVGIGTSVPASRLDVRAAAGSGSFVTLVNTSTTANTNVIETSYTLNNAQTGSATAAVIGATNPAATGNTYGDIYFKTTNPTSGLTEKMRIDSAGNVGIGTNAPGTKLDVTGSAIRVSNTTGYNSSSAVRLDIGASNSDSVDNSATYQWSMNTSGNAGGQSLLFSAYRRADTTLEAMRINGSGDISIGTTFARSRLCIARNSSVGTVGASASIVLSNRNTTLNGGLAGGIFIDTFRDVADPQYTAGIWFTRSSQVSNLSSSSDIVFGAANTVDVNELPTERMRINAAGNITASVDFRAPIFKDSGNSAYYVDPDSTSSLKGLTLSPGVQGVTTGFYINGGDMTASRNGTTGAIYLGTGSSQYIYFDGSAFEFGPSGFVTSSTSMRAPVFYDTNDTTYYVDPASNGTRAGFINGNLWINPKTESYGEGIVFNMPNQNTWGGLRWYRNGAGASYAGNWAFGYFGGENTNDIGFHNGINGWRLDHSYNNTVAGSFRAPIFYDSNDTTYFVNPNSTSSIYNTLTIGPNITYGRYLRLGGDAGDATEATVAASNGNLHIDAKTGYKLYLSWFNTADTMVGGAIQALAYYDRENTGYYIDAATNSVLNTLSLGGRSTNYAMYYQGFTLDANTMDHNATGFTYGVNAPYVGPIVRLSAGGGYDLQLNAPYSGNGNKLSYRTRQGDAGIFNGWQPVATYNSNYGGELFATLFTDSDSTGYFVNPAGNSAFEALTVRKSGVSLGSGNSRQLEINNAASGACNISFHREGVFGAHFGLDIDNWFSTFGWSAGAGYTNMRVGALEADFLMRRTHSSGHLRGGYNNIGASETQTSPIYCIGSNYEPAATTLGAMYGIGFTANGTFFPSGASGWGMYTADAGISRIFLGAGTGNITATGTITASASDKRLKTNITPISNALDKLMQINGVEFDWVDNITDIGFQPQNMHETGVIAQEIQKVIPDAVTIAPFNNIATEIQGVDNEYLTVDKEKIIALLIEAIKEQQASINRLEDKLNLLENK